MMIVAAVLAGCTAAGAITPQRVAPAANGAALVDPDQTAEHIVDSARQAQERARARPFLNNSNLVGGSASFPGAPTGLRPFR